LFLNYTDSNLPNDLKTYLFNKENKIRNNLRQVCHYQKIKKISIPRFYPRIQDNMKFVIEDKYGIIIIIKLPSIIKNLNIYILNIKINSLTTDRGLILINNYIHSVEKGTIPFIIFEDQSINI